MASAEVSAEISMMTRARATTCAAADSAGSLAIDRLARRPALDKFAPDLFMVSPSPTQTSVLVTPDEAGGPLPPLVAPPPPGLSPPPPQPPLTARHAPGRGPTVPA